MACRPPARFLALAELVLLVFLSARCRGQDLVGNPNGAWDPFASDSLFMDSVGTAPLTVADIRQGACSSAAPPIPVLEMTIETAHRAMLGGRLTCTELVTAYIQRIQAYDQPTQLNSVRAVAPHVLKQAAELDQQLQAILAGLSDSTPPAHNNGTAASSTASGYPVGTESPGTMDGERGSGGVGPTMLPAVLPPLFCVPLLVKDNFDVEGMATTAGSVALRNNFPQEDAHVIQRLRLAGALVLGKTNMGEFAFFPSFTMGSLFGVVRNPYHLGHTPAGSSGGSAAGVAANLGMAGLGTDTGNSVRGPASHTALVGIRPSLGLTSRSGILPLRIDRDTSGPMARTVEDAVRVLEVMAGFDPGDPITHMAQEPRSLPANYTQFLQPSGLVGARIGVLRQVSALQGADPAIQLLFEEALLDLQRGGAVLVDNFELRGNRLGLDWEAGQGGLGPALGNWNVNGRWEDLWGCQSPLRSPIEHATLPPFKRRLGVDAYLSASNSTDYQTLEEIVRAGAHHPQAGPELLGALQANYTPEEYPTSGMRALGLMCGCGYFWTDPCRMEFRRVFIASMDALRLDAVVHPTWNQPPLPVGQTSKGFNTGDGNNSPMISPHIGAPAVTVPMGYTGKSLPAGLHLMARPFEEPTLIKLACAYEQLSGHRIPPPMFPECRDAAVHEAEGWQPAG